MNVNTQESTANATAQYGDEPSSMYYIDKWGNRDGEYMICGEYGRRVSRLRLYATIAEAEIALMLFRQFEVK